MKKFTVIFMFFGLLIGDQKSKGLMLKKDASTVIIPYGQTIEIGFDDVKTLKEGVLFNVSLDTIYLKSISSNKTITIPKNKIYGINASARTLKMKDFRQGVRIGGMMGIGLGTIVTFQQYLENRDPNIFIGSVFFTPIFAVIGSVGGGLIHMSNQGYQINNIDIFAIDKDNWKIIF
tara:strand:+ start:1012 stop:1539 length:528 start_codon:yes stop_codon:yes gene_type:complete